MDLRIYNIFPRLYAGPEEWLRAAEHAKDLGFNAVYLNPFLKTGETKSIYAIRDHYKPDLLSFPGDPARWLDDLRTFLDRCRALDLQPIFDLVANHTSVDHPFTRTRRAWYQQDAVGNIQPARTATADGRLVVWGDCAKLDYSDPHSGLWEYMEDLCRYYLDLGFTGFRCDVAAHVPAYFWKHLISRLRQDHPGVLFMGEAFLASSGDILGLAGAGFDYIFSSAKWWDYQERWFPEQNDFHRRFLSTISFPDNHDTLRLMEEYGGNTARCLQRLRFTAVISSGFLLSGGFEYGYRKKPDVHCAAVQEDTGLDFTSEVRDAMALRDRHPVFRQDGHLEMLTSSPEVLVLRKDVPNESALLVLNLTDRPTELTLPSFGWDSLPERVSLEPWDFQYFTCPAPGLPENETLFLTAPRTFFHRRYEMDRLRSGEALVEIHSCGVCGSDRLEYRQGPFYWYPSCTGGHEFSGIVRTLEGPCGNLRVGDAVVYRIPLTGTGIVQGGGFSKYSVVRADCLFPLDPGADLLRAVLIEPLAVAVHGARRVPGACCTAIVGSGPLALLLERYLAACRPHAERTLFYKHPHVLGHTMPGTQCRPAGEDCDSHFDAVFECSGDQDALRAFLPRLNPGGAAVILGIYSAEAMVDLTTLMFGERRIEGSYLYTPDDFACAAGLIQNSVIQTADLLQPVPFNRYEDAFERPSDQRLKTVLVTGGTS